MINLKREYKKYKKARYYNFTFTQYLFREVRLLEDKIYRKFLLYHLENDKDIVEAVHSVKIYNKLYRRYRRILLDKSKVDNDWTTTKFPKVIWWCWLQGIDNVPELANICLHSLKSNLPDYNIKIITLENLREYIEIPQCIQKKYEVGWIAGAQFSDIVRLLLLAKYGGIWVDSTVYCTDNKLIKVIEKSNMFVYQNILSPNNDVIKMSSWLIATKKNNPYIVEASKLLLHYYETRNYTEDYFVCHLILTMLSEKYTKLWHSMDAFNNVNPHMMQYMLNRKFSKETFNRIKANASFHKLNRHIKFQDGDTFYNYLKAEDSLCGQKS